MTNTQKQAARIAALEAKLREVRDIAESAIYGMGMDKVIFTAIAAAENIDLVGLKFNCNSQVKHLTEVAARLTERLGKE
jgi:diaminopimelate decarboxylase